MLRIGIVSPEKHWATQVSAIFPEWEMHVDQLETLSSILLGNIFSWDSLVLDLDAIESVTFNIVEFIRIAADRAHHTIVLIPQRLMHLEPKFSGTGIFVLHKPTSSGEIALALRMLFREI
jgi:hypothetical protein